MVNWVPVKMLGQGSYGKVFLAKSTMDPLDYFAIKVARLHKDSTLAREKKILKYFIGCPEIVQCLGSEITVIGDYILYNIKLEYAVGGTLEDLIAQRKKLPEDEVKEYLKMILKGLSCIHSKGFVHADLKPANILAFPQSNGKMKLKIADFGLSRRCGEKDVNLIIFKGTPDFMSPESLISSEFNYALDIWSLGCIFVEMVSGEPVWEDFSSMHLVSKLVNMEIPKIPEELSKKRKNFIKRCFDQNPKRRWTTDMLLEHPYLKKENETRNNGHEVSILPRGVQSSNYGIRKLLAKPKFPKELYFASFTTHARIKYSSLMILLFVLIMFLRLLYLGTV